MRRTPWRATGISGGPPPLPIGRIHGRHAWIESTHAKMVLNMVWIPDKEIVMFNSLDVLDDLVPVSELSNGRTAAVLNKADRAPVIIIKRNKPSYVLMGINDYQDLLDRLEDTEDARLAEKRIEDNNGRETIPNADLMAELGLTEEDIADTPTPEMA
ncbi:type II toxin-antitoxin system Phd/YefM family antitoxin [Bifidobacterium pseudocatenulatum]|uniref:Antitoxin n=2 Tax=Bifidobacterium pseudocatenulatum TaxID=28026 RepID=A0A3E5HHE2_BIFPS|nr:type II toxin-antitoxin system Phd/YefM family antitoxin [Bifidobacterium pseudocatenulatum]RGT64972.1 type II toxin-antitoxin system Phd/YefM family antitoxin [Bifidobacterium pseudocatenulatum]